MASWKGEKKEHVERKKVDPAREAELARREAFQHPKSTVPTRPIARGSLIPGRGWVESSSE